MIRAKNVAIIPARAGSSRLPNKNFKDFRGKPMIAWPIEILKSMNIFDQVVVSTDSEEISEISLFWGADRVVNRPHELAENSVPTIRVVSHALDAIGAEDVDRVCVAYATNPLLSAAAISLTLERFLSDSEALFYSVVSKFGFPPQRGLLREESNYYSMKDQENLFVGSQDLAPVFHETGQFWWATGETWRSGTAMQIKMKALALPSFMQQDIDNKEDWLLAEAKFDYLQNFPALNLDKQQLENYNLF